MTKRPETSAPNAAPARRRRPYTPPRIEQIDIVPGEAMLGFCKTTGDWGGMGLCGGGCSMGGS